MEFLLWILGLLLLKKLWNVIFCTREYWEKEVAKYNDNETVGNCYDLPISLRRDYPNLQTIKRTEDVIKSVVENTTHIIVKGGKYIAGTTKKLKPTNKFEKVDKIAEKIKIKTDFTPFIIIFWLILVTILANEMRSYILFLKDISFYNVLDVFVAVTSLCLILLVVYFLVKDIGGIISLRQTEDTKAKVDKFVKEEKCRELKHYLLSLKASASKKKELKTEFKKLDTSLEVVTTFEQMVLKECDEKVDKVICDYRTKVIIGNGISDSSLLDFAVNLYYFYKILHETAQIYQVKIGFISLMRILGGGCLVCYAVSKATNMLENIILKLFDGAALLIPLKYLVQAVTSGFSMQIYGYWLKYYALRPIKSYDLEMKKQTTKELNNFFKDKQDN